MDATGLFSLVLCRPRRRFVFQHDLKQSSRRREKSTKTGDPHTPWRGTSYVRTIATDGPIRIVDTATIDINTTHRQTYYCCAWNVRRAVNMVRACTPEYQVWYTGKNNYNYNHVPCNHFDCYSYWRYALLLKLLLNLVVVLCCRSGVYNCSSTSSNSNRIIAAVEVVGVEYLMYLMYLMYSMYLMW